MEEINRWLEDERKKLGNMEFIDKPLKEIIHLLSFVSETITSCEGHYSVGGKTLGHDEITEDKIKNKVKEFAYEVLNQRELIISHTPPQIGLLCTPDDFKMIQEAIEHSNKQLGKRHIFIERLTNDSGLPSGVDQSYIETEKLPPEIKSSLIPARIRLYSKKRGHDQSLIDPHIHTILYYLSNVSSKHKYWNPIEEKLLEIIKKYPEPAEKDVAKFEKEVVELFNEHKNLLQGILRKNKGGVERNYDSVGYTHNEGIAVLTIRDKLPPRYIHGRGRREIRDIKEQSLKLNNISDEIKRVLQIAAVARFKRTEGEKRRIRTQFENSLRKILMERRVLKK